MESSIMWGSEPLRSGTLAWVLVASICFSGCMTQGPEDGNDKSMDSVAGAESASVSCPSDPWYVFDDLSRHDLEKRQQVCDCIRDLLFPYGSEEWKIVGMISDQCFRENFSTCVRAYLDFGYQGERWDFFCRYMESNRQEWRQPSYGYWAGQISSLRIPPDYKLIVCDDVKHVYSEGKTVPACKGNSTEFTGDVWYLEDWNDRIKYVELVPL